MKYINIFVLLSCTLLLGCLEEKDIAPDFKGTPGGGLLGIEVQAVNGNEMDLCVDLFAVNHFGSFIADIGTECFDSIAGSGVELVIDRIENKQQDEEGPYSALMLFDQSGSITNTDPENARIDAGKGFIDVLGDGEEASVAVFTTDDFYYNPPFEVLLPFSDNKSRLKDTIENMRFQEGGGTPLYASITGLLDYVRDNAKNDNLAIIVFTDGEDTEGGSIPLLIQEAQDRDIEVYTVGLGNDVNQTELTIVALGTGGAVMFAEEVDQLVALYRSLADLLRGRGEYYTTCWTAVKPFGVWASGESFSFTIELKLPTGEVIRYPVTGIVP